MDIALVFGGCHRRGGVERSVWEMARHLSERHAVSVYANDIEADGLEDVRLVPLDLASGRPLRPLRFASAARNALAKRRHQHIISFGVGDVGADVLWVNSVHRAWLRNSLDFRGSAGMQRFPFLRYLDPRHQILLGMEWHYFTQSRAKAVVNVSDTVGDDLHRLYRVPREVMTTIHNGFSREEFSPERRRRLRSDSRAEFGYGDQDVVALIAANELVRKGFDVLTQAQALVGDPRLRVLLVGRRPPSKVQNERLRYLGVADRVTYAGSRTDMGRIHAAADIFVLPSQYEAFALAVIEALASGLPVITTVVPGAGDRINDHFNGLLLQDPRSASELACLLAQAMDSNERELWASNAARSVVDLSWPHLFSEAEELLKSLSTRR